MRAKHIAFPPSARFDQPPRRRLRPLVKALAVIYVAALTAGAALAFSALIQLAQKPHEPPPRPSYLPQSNEADLWEMDGQRYPETI